MLPPEPTPASTPAPAAAAATDTRPTSTTGRPVDPTPGLLTVAIEVVRPVWLRADADGKRELARTVAAGERLQIHAAREVTLRAGDAGAVMASINGGAKTRLGADGAVITRRIAGPPGRSETTAASASLGEPAGPAARPEQSARDEAAQRLPDVTRTAGAPSGARPTGELPELLPSPLSPAPALASPARSSSSPTSATPPGAPPPRASGAPASVPAGDAGSAVPSSALTPSEHEVFQAHETYFDALRRNDQTAMRRVMAPNFTATGMPPPLGTGSLSVNSVSVQVSGVGAVVSGVASRADIGSDGRPTSALLFSEVWTNTDGQWQLLSVRFVEPPRR
jgi:hypothetical protein